MRRNIKLIALINFFTDFKFHSAVLVIYFTRVTGSFTLSMSLFSIIMVSSALFEIPTGIFSDYLGRKKTVTMGAIFASAAAIFYATGQSYWILAVGALLEGISRSWYSGNNDALLHDTLNALDAKDSYAHYLGKTGSMFQLALMSGAVIGSILSQWSFALIMWLSVIPQTICVVLTFFLTDPAKTAPGKSNIFAHLKFSALHLWKNRKLRLLSMQDILSFGIGESSFDFAAAFIQTVWPLWAIGFSKMISYGGAFISFWTSGKLIRKFGAVNILITANIYTRIANFISYGFPTPVSPVLMASSSVFYGATTVSKTTLMQNEYTQEQRATLGSLNAFLGHMFFGVFSLLLGVVADLYGPANALLFVQVCMLSVLVINIRLKKYYP